jgi:predicted enzyme related to lactoylglutathione lyase
VADPVVHFEVLGKDPAKLRGYYGTLFGWEFSNPIGPTDYALVERFGNADGIGIGGGVGGVPEGYEGHVTFYVEVADVAAALERAESLGGKRLMGPDAVPGGPTIGQFADPEGHVVGVVGSGAPGGG